MTMEEYQKAYYDGMTASEWVQWAKQLNWLMTPEKPIVKSFE